ncbi:unnamed protein product [Linum trigynum]|uniref:Uncharacterized protein n=1 Tax=Linum trigynum TaxID=586398 RepID=A0AAV2DIH7_9ROSI
MLIFRSFFQLKSSPCSSELPDASSSILFCSNRYPDFTVYFPSSVPVQHNTSLFADEASGIASIACLSSGVKISSSRSCLQVLVPWSIRVDTLASQSMNGQEKKTLKIVQIRDPFISPDSKFLSPGQ